MIDTSVLSGSNGAVTADYLLTGGEMTAKSTYPRMVLTDGILYVAWSTDKIDGDNNDYYSIHVVRSPDGGVTWQSLSATPLIPPFGGDQGGDTTEVTHPVERPCSTWLAGFAVTRGKAHFLYKNDSNDNLPCSLKRTMRYQRFNVAGGAREADVTGFAPANVPFDSRDGFFAISARAGSLLATGRTKDNRIATVASTDDGNTWSLKSQSAPLMDNIYAIGGQREVTAEGMVLGSYTHDGSPAAVRFLKASVLKNSIAPTGTPLAATLTANAEAAGYPIQNAGDADDATVWVANLTPTGTNNNAWVQLDLGATKYVSRLTSIDGWNYTRAVSRTNAVGVIDGDELVDRNARFIRLTTTKVNDGTGWSLSFHELWAE